jgi:exodeoxyribonuclease V alpha subunit
VHDTLTLLDESTYSGTVEVLAVAFRNDDLSYAVMEVEDEETGGEFDLIGPVAHLRQGDRAEVSGEWENHSRYGRQLRADGALPLDPVDRRGLIAYLSSLRHIGPTRAERLVDEYGKGVLKSITASPAGVFGSLRGISEKQAKEAAESWQASRAIRDLHIQLAPHGLAHLAGRIQSRYGEGAMAILHEDPYRLTEIEGIGFARADKIALASDMPADADRRAQAAAVFALADAEQDGHTNLPLRELQKRTEKLIDRPVDTDVLLGARGLLLDHGYAYRERTFDSEVAVAQMLHSRASAPPHLDYEPERDHQEGLTDEQWEAVRGAFAARISVLTGGPGVGKTVCTRAIVTAALEADIEIALCAPTGRASRRLEEATDFEAQTIHRMLEWTPGREPHYNPDNPLPVDLVIVDESSMLNLRLAQILLGGLAESTHIVFVGDADQLPPIGAGKPFEDLIESGIVPVVRLNRIFRQAARSMITTAAHEINRGRPPHLAPEEDQEHDFLFVERSNPEAALQAVIDVVAEQTPDEFGFDPIRDVQVLAPMYRGAVGLNVLNERLREQLNPRGKPALNERFRIGDRLIQTRNSHDLGLMNGSIVFLRSDDPREQEVLVDTDEGGTLLIPYNEASDLRLAYAISVHKAQGCEVPVVVGVCHRSHLRMLSRPLLYTAITRARNVCVLVGDLGVLETAISRDEGSVRYSGLAERLQD